MVKNGYKRSARFQFVLQIVYNYTKWDATANRYIVPFFYGRFFNIFGIFFAN